MPDTLRAFSSLLRRTVPLAILAALAILAGCNSPSPPTTAERLADEVDNAQSVIRSSRYDYQNAIERLAAVLEYDNEELAERHAELVRVERTLAGRADQVDRAVTRVEEAGAAFFEEWTADLDQYADSTLRARSQAHFDASRARYTRLVAAMQAATARVRPVEAALHDQVLALKHALAADVVGAIDGQAADFDADVSALIVDMQKASTDAEAFLDTRDAQP